MARASRETADSTLLYVGSYTDAAHPHGIHLVEMRSSNGELRLVGSADGGPNPSFLAIHPNGRALYAVNEVAEHEGSPTGSVSAFAIEGREGALTPIDSQSSGGRGPCYVSVDPSGHAALVANYDSGSVAMLPLGGNGALGQATSVMQHTGHGPNADRQEGPHAHCIVAHPANRFALATDLGIDRVLVYELDLRVGTLRHHEAGDAVMRPGSGPRHIAFHPTRSLVFVTKELDSTVTTLRFDADRGTLAPVATTLTVPKGSEATNYPADIHVAPLGNVLYVSNRGHDSIAVFSIDDTTGDLTLVQTMSTDGEWPRNFSLDPTARWLVAANQRSSSLVVFGRDPRSGRLTPTSQRLDVASPACVRFRCQHGPNCGR